MFPSRGRAGVDGSHAASGGRDAPCRRTISTHPPRRSLSCCSATPSRAAFPTRCTGRPHPSSGSPARRTRGGKDRGAPRAVRLLAKSCHARPGGLAEVYDAIPSRNVSHGVRPDLAIRAQAALRSVVAPADAANARPSTPRRGRRPRIVNTHATSGTPTPDRRRPPDGARAWRYFRRHHPRCGALGRKPTRPSS